MAPRLLEALLLLALALCGVPLSSGLINSSWTVNTGVAYGLNTSKWWFGTGDAGTGSWVQSGCNNTGPYGGASCSPAYCAATRNSLPTCTTTALLNGNTTNATFATLLSRIVGHTCSVAPQTQDARCTAAALSAVYSQYPGILAAYCNEEYLVVHSSVMPNHPTFLGDIPTPPLGTLSNGTTCCTRAYVQSWYYAKIPLRPTALTTASGAVNNLNNFLTGVSGITGGTNDAYYAASSPISSLIGQFNMPNGGPIAWALNGLPWFNNFPSGTYTWANCEMDKCNSHAGQGLDLHYHGDPFGPQCMYSAANYANTSVHPPLIGYGADGYPIFGRHLSSNAPGYSVALDECGGHVHTGMGDTYITDGTYHVRSQHSWLRRLQRRASFLLPHPLSLTRTCACLRPCTSQYHSFLLNNSVTNPTVKFATGSQATGTYTYTAYANGPFLCYKGDISKNTNFWSPYYVPYSMGDLSSHSDFYQIQPCTSSALYVNSAVGISINASKTSLASSGTSISTSLTASVGSTSGSSRRLLERLLLQSSTALTGFAASETPPDVLPGIPPGFIEMFPNTVAQFLGLKNASFVSISQVSKQLNTTGQLTGLTIYYLITTPDVATSQRLITALNLLPNNASFVAALASKFPGVTAAIIGSSTILVNGQSSSNSSNASTPVSSPPPANATTSPTASPPPAAPANTTAITGAQTLSGYIASTFGTAQAAAYKGVLATAAGVTSSSVYITSVANAAGSGRHLAQSSVTVAYSILVPSSSNAATAIANIGAITATSLQAGGLTACTDVAVAIAPTQAAAVSLPTDVTNTLASTPPSSAAAGRHAVSGAVALAAIALAL